MPPFRKKYKVLQIFFEYEYSFQYNPTTVFPPVGLRSFKNPSPVTSRMSIHHVLECAIVVQAFNTVC